MTDATLSQPQSPSQTSGPRKKTSLLTVDKLTRKRNAAETRFRLYGIAAILVGLAFLVALLWAIFSNGLTAFSQTFVSVPISLDRQKVEEAEASMVKTSRYNAMIEEGLAAELAKVGIETEMGGRDLRLLLSSGAAASVRDFVLANPDEIGKTVTFDLLASSRVDGYMKGRVTRDALVNDKNLDAAHLDIVDVLAKDGIVVKRFNTDFILGADASDSRPEEAGIGVAMIGSFYMMLVVLALALPIGVAASIYLEEFAPKNRFTDLIEVNISNLAAVPSIVFGILGLAAFIQFAHLPQSAPLVGGLVQQRELEGGIACDEDIARPHAARERIIAEHGPAVGWQRRPLDADLVDVGNPSGGGEDMVEFFFAVLACLAPANDDFLPRPRNMRVGVPCSRKLALEGGSRIVAHFGVGERTDAIVAAEQVHADTQPVQRLAKLETDHTRTEHGDRGRQVIPVENVVIDDQSFAGGEQGLRHCRSRSRRDDDRACRDDPSAAQPQGIVVLEAGILAEKRHAFEALDGLSNEADKAVPFAANARHHAFAVDLRGRAVDAEKTRIARAMGRLCGRDQEL